MEHKIKELPNTLRPRERLKKYGAKFLNTEELLAIILRTGTKNKNAIDIAREILININLEEIENYSVASLSKIKGIGEVKAITLLAALEIGRRSLITNNNDKIQIRSSDDAYDLFYNELINLKQEKLLVIFLDTKKYIINYKILFVGTVNASTVHPRDIFREAVMANAVNIIIMHNHPSNDITPSYNDDIFTNKLVNLGKMMGIVVIDHIIVGNNNYYSYNKRWNDENEKK